MGKFLLGLVAGAAAGYVLGTKAGRERYDQLVDASRAAADPDRVVASTSKVASSVAKSANDLAHKAKVRVRGDREIVLPLTDEQEITPPSTP
jgi:hypothetical protein